MVVAKEDVAAFIEEASKENLLCTPVAVVTEAPRLVMHWMGNRIVDISREFLNSNGAAKYTDVSVPAPAQLKTDRFEGADLESRAKAVLSDLSLCSQKGLVERFDSTIGAGTVLMPFGGNTQLTPSQAMAAKIPLEKGETNTCSLMAYGFDPYLSEQSPYHGAACAVVESMAKLVAAGGSHERSWLTFQEYFERTKGDPKRWGKPAAALLGAFAAQTGLKVGAIGGKDSMSGTFEQIDVPPTLVSFAVSVAKTQDIITTDFKGPEHQVVVACPKYDQNGLPVYDSVCSVFCQVETLRKEGKLLSAWALGMGGLLEAVCKMGFGNRIGFAFDASVKMEDLTCPCYGGFVLELAEGVDCPMSFTVVGVTQAQPEISGFGQRVSHKELLEIWENRLERVFPYHTAQGQDVKVESYTFSAVSRSFPAVKIAQPQVVIPVFPGTNCEYDTARAFERAGAKAEMLVILNQTASDIEQSVTAMAQAISKSQMIAIPGGFSGGDEPDGSGKFIATTLRNPRVADAVMRLLNERDGLMLGICNGFQALIKLGLVPNGTITEIGSNDPTLTFNTIGRHVSRMAYTRITSVKSPWFAGVNAGDVFAVPVSHGEGRFVADKATIETLAANGQIATQYCAPDGSPSLDITWNPNGSEFAIEGITSPDGRILGKMGHSERRGENLYRNVPGNKDQKIFASGVSYFK